MRLSAPGEQYEFDWKFWAISICAMLIVSGAFWKGKQMIDRANGRQVQKLITRENLASPQAFKQQARNYIAASVRHHRLSSGEAARAEEIYADGLYQYGKTWMDGRMNSLSREEIRRRQAEIMRQADAKFQAYLRSIGK